MNILNKTFLLITACLGFISVGLMADEKKSLRRAVVWTAVFLIIYLVTLILIEGSYINDVLGPLTKWNY